MKKSDFYYTCPHCSTNLFCSHEQQGKILTCPKCGNEIVPCPMTTSEQTNSQLPHLNSQQNSVKTSKTYITENNNLPPTTYKETLLVASLKRDSKVARFLAFISIGVILLLMILLPLFLDASSLAIILFLWPIPLFFHFLHRHYRRQVEHLEHMEKCAFTTAENSKRIVCLLQKIANK